VQENTHSHVYTKDSQLKWYRKKGRKKKDLCPLVKGIKKDGQFLFIVLLLTHNNEIIPVMMTRMLMSILTFRMETIAFKMIGTMPAATAARARNLKGGYTNLRNESNSSKPEAAE